MPTPNSNPTLFFLPGAGADPSFWRPVADRLPSAWTKHHFSYPGLADQPPIPVSTSFDDLNNLVEARLDITPRCFRAT